MVRPAIIAILLWFSLLPAMAQRSAIDRMLLQLKSEKNIDSRLRLLNQLSESHLNHTKDSALLFAERAITLSKEEGIKHWQAIALTKKGNVLARYGDDSTAIHLYNAALAIDLGDRYDTVVARINWQLGSAFYHMAQYDQALAELYKALSVFEKHQLKKQQAEVLNSIGNVFYFTNKPEAAKYYTLSLKIHEELGNEDGVASQLGNLGLIYISTMDFEKAIDYSTRSLQAYQKLGYERSIATSLLNLSYAYNQVGKASKALGYAQRSLALRKKLNEPRGIAKSTIMLANVYFKLEDSASAIQHYEEGIALARELGLRSYEWEAMSYLAQCYVKQGRLKEALELYPKVIDIKDSIYSQESRAQIAEMETKYNTLQKDAEIQLLTKEALISDLQLRKRETYLLTATVITFLLGIISLVIYFFYRTKARANSDLERKNLEISDSKKEIEEKNLDITHSIRYAERLQSAILPKDDSFAKHFEEFHILYRPKDIVSGDFYWMEELDGVVFLAAADCTGHGVPGAMVSMVGFQGLNKTVLEERLTSPAAILQRLSDHVEKVFGKSGGSVKDGMDICLVAIDLKKRTVTYSGAHNDLWILTTKKELPNANLREEENGNYMFELKADRRSIGGFMDAGSFTETTVELNQGDRLFLFSDGYADQFGGPQGKKLGSKRMRGTLREMALSGNLMALGAILQDWKGNEEQVDDVTVLSITI